MEGRNDNDFFNNFNKGKDSYDDFEGLGDLDDDLFDIGEVGEVGEDDDENSDFFNNDREGNEDRGHSNTEGLDLDNYNFGERDTPSRGNTREKMGVKNDNGNQPPKEEGVGLLGKLLGMFGLSNTDSLLYKIVKWGIILFLILFVGVFLIGYVLIGGLIGGDKEEETTQRVEEEQTFFEGVNDKIFGILKGDEKEGESKSKGGNTNEGIGAVEVEGSYEEDYHNLVKTNVFRYKQPAVLDGVTFKILEVEDYNNQLLPEDTEREYIRAFFAIKNESENNVKFSEYDFNLYTKESLDKKNKAKDKEGGYVGIDEENKKMNVDVEGLGEELKSLFSSEGQEPTIIRAGDGSTTLGKGVVNPGEVYSAYVVFEVVPGEVREYVLGFDTPDLPMEILLSTY